MQVLRLIQQNGLSLPFRLGKELGHGLDGQVFKIADTLKPAKVVKLCAIFESEETDLNIDYQQVSQVLDCLLQKNPLAFVRIFSHAKLGEYYRTIYGNQQQKYLLHYYVMERLQAISEDEKKVFHTILSHEDRGIEKTFTITELERTLEGLHSGLDFSMDKMRRFRLNLHAAPIIHNDLHPRNILKNIEGNYKCIDIDWCELKFQPT